MPTSFILIVRSTAAKTTGVLADRTGLTLTAGLGMPCRHVDAINKSNLALVPAPAAALLFGHSCADSAADAEQIRRIFPQTPLLAVVAQLDSPRLIPKSFDALSDYLLHPFTDADIILRVHRLISREGIATPKPPGRAGAASANLLLGDSAAFVKAKSMLHVIARLDATCLIEGETGTGKELFARAIHYLGARRGSPFVPLNCGAVPDSLIESELFGHVKGAYTDARTASDGLIRYAEDGTLFLDEIDALSSGAQVKLLRVLQEGEFRPIGSARLMQMDARIVAASNSNLRERVRLGQFREDLFHRLNILRLTIPPLRQRGDDIMLLAHHFVNRYGPSSMRFESDAVVRLRQYEWPGNVRELQAAVQRAVLLSKDDSIRAEDLDIPDQADLNVAAVESKDLMTAKSRLIGDFERTYLEEILRSHDGNVTHAAEAAGKDRRSFQRLLKKHSIAASPRSRYAAAS